MLEYLINGEMRVSTFLKLIAQYWELIGAIILVGIAALFSLFKKGN